MSIYAASKVQKELIRTILGIKAKNMTYKEAIEEIEKILRSLREEQNSIDTLSERVARATELIALCREKLRKAESEVNSIIEN